MYMGEIKKKKKEYKNSLSNLKELLGFRHRGEDTVQKSLNPTKKFTRNVNLQIPPPQNERALLRRENGIIKNDQD